MCKPTTGPPPARQIALFGFFPLYVALVELVPRTLIASMAALLAPGALAANISIAAMTSAVFAAVGAFRAILLIVSIAVIAAVGSLRSLDWFGALAGLGAVGSLCASFSPLPPFPPLSRLSVFM